MINYMVFASEFENAEVLKDYAIKKLSTIEKYLKTTHGAQMHIELLRTTKHKHGMIYTAEATLSLGGRVYFAKAIADDMHRAIDQLENELIRAVISKRGRVMALWRHGARKVKDMMKRSQE
jgi:ribosomal subunit interface protein